MSQHKFLFSDKLRSFKFRSGHQSRTLKNPECESVSVTNAPEWIA